MYSTAYLFCKNVFKQESLSLMKHLMDNFWNERIVILLILLQVWREKNVSG